MTFLVEFYISDPSGVNYYGAPTIAKQVEDAKKKEPLTRTLEEIGGVLPSKDQIIFINGVYCSVKSVEIDYDEMKINVRSERLAFIGKRKEEGT